MGLCGSKSEGAESDMQSRPPVSADQIAIDQPVSEVAANLARVPLLSRLTQAELSQLATHVIQRRYACGDPLCTEGDAGHEFFILRSGCAAVRKHDPANPSVAVEIAQLKPGDYAGEQALLSNSKRGASVVSIAPEGTDCYVLGGDAFRALFGDRTGTSGDATQGAATPAAASGPNGASPGAGGAAAAAGSSRASSSNGSSAKPKLHVNWAKRAAISAEASGGAGGFGGRGTMRRTASSAERGSAASPSSMPEGARVSKSAEEVADIQRAVRDNLLFRGLDDKQRGIIIDKMWLRAVAPGEVLIRQGELGDNFYAVRAGRFDIFVADKQTVQAAAAAHAKAVAEAAGDPVALAALAAQQQPVEGARVATREAGSSFGELALMYNSLRAASVRACEPSECWCVDRGTFRRVVTNSQHAKLAEYESFLRGVHCFEVLLENERARIAEALEEVTYPAGHRIVNQGEAGDTLFIVHTGEVVVTQTRTDPATGSTTEIECTRYHSGNCFGERSLMLDAPRAATCTAVTDVMCLYLNREAFVDLLGPMEDVFRDRIEGYATQNSAAATSGAGAGDTAADALTPTMAPKASPASPAASSASSLSPPSSPATKSALTTMDPSLRLADLRVVGMLGKGSFGTVQLVSHANGHTYALKSVSKAQVVRLGQQDHILSEKRVMAALNHPCCIKLCATFKDAHTLYFLLEPSLGGELFTLLRAQTHFTEDAARFFAAGVVLAFEYMHSKGIVYRDLKPENLLLSANGYLKITDFGFAKKIGEARTWTLCGTPDYLAPEVVSGSGHGKGVDWWCLGILIFEMLASYPPFYDDDPMRTYAKIIKGDIAFPLHFTRSASDLIRALLNPKPTKRLGITSGGAQQIKKHAWFHGFDWKAFEAQSLPAPFVLPIKSSSDLSNFESYANETLEIVPYTPDPSLPKWDEDF